MTDWAKDSTQHWACERGLDFTEAGLLPPATPTLEAGLGAGAHRAGMVRTQSDRGFTSVGGFTVRPERATYNLCAGRLPGGAVGVLAHHVSLVHGFRDDEGGWSAVPETVVYLRVPEAVRVTRALHGLPVAESATIKALFGGPIVTTNGPGVTDVAGWRWRADADAPSMADLADPGTAAALAQLPPRTVVELWDGTLVVAARGVVEDPAALDGLCEVASGIARGLDRVAGGLDLVGPDDVLAPPVAAPETASIPWPVPPASVAVAKRAYERDLRADGSIARRLRRGSLRAGVLSVLAAMAGAAVLDGAMGLGAAGAAAAAAFAFLVIGPATVVAELRSGRRASEQEIDGKSSLWGLDAFAAGYARRCGLAQEDHNAFRRGFAAPLAGMPLRVWRGELAPGITGRLAIWIDRTDRSRTSYAVVAIAPLPAAGAAGAPIVDGYRTAILNGLLIVWQDVAAEDRSAEALDALRGAVAAAFVLAGELTAV